MGTEDADHRLLPRALLYATTGFVWFAYWLEQDRTPFRTPMRVDWGAVLWFSAVLLLLGFTIVVFGRGLEVAAAKRWANIAGAGAGLSSLANIIEDGFQVEPAFYVFILGTLILDAGLLAMAFATLVRAHWRDKLLALIPGGALAGVLFFVAAGGFIMLVTWTAAAGSLARYRRRYIFVPMAIVALTIFTWFSTQMSMMGASYWWTHGARFAFETIRGTWATLTGQPLTRDLFPF